MRNRSSAVLIKGHSVGLIKRVREGKIYYVFPGGGIEKGETPEKAAEREAFEELGIEVNIKKLIAKINFNGAQYFFLSDIIGGIFGTGEGEEYTDKNRGRGDYLPVWVDIEKLSSLEVRPKEIAIKLQAIIYDQKYINGAEKW